MGWAIFWPIFFTNASGHPDADEEESDTFACSGMGVNAIHSLLFRQQMLSL
jgi:hypothetical protein